MENFASQREIVPPVYATSLEVNRASDELKRGLWLWAFIVLAALAILREPLFFTAPRLWAEEGNVFLAAAYDLGAWRAVFAPHVGYFLLPANFAGAITAGLYDLRAAAAVFTFISLAAYVGVMALVATTPGRFAATAQDRLLIVFALLILGSAEVWLNTITLQFWFAAGTFFILTATQLRMRHLIALAVAFTTGVPSLFFAPWFFLRAYSERSRHAYAACALAILGTLVQVSALFAGWQTEVSNRFNPADIVNLPRAIFATVIRPLLTLGTTPVEIAAAALGVAAVLATIIAAAIKRQRTDILLWGAAPLALFALLAILSSFGMGGGTRYGFAVSVGLFAVALTSWRVLWSTKAALMLGGLLLAVNVPAYFDTQLFYDPAWTAWTPAVAEACQSDAATVALFPQWPEAKWTMPLPRAAC